LPFAFLFSYSSPVFFNAPFLHFREVQFVIIIIVVIIVTTTTITNNTSIIIFFL
jgi:hypothetical protein